jgi:hypothetical protein
MPVGICEPGASIKFIHCLMCSSKRCGSLKTTCDRTAAQSTMSSRGTVIVDPAADTERCWRKCVAVVTAFGQCLQGSH